MIVKDNGKDFELIRQHDHAFVSYQIARHWQLDFFPCLERRQEVLTAIRNHDCAWIPLDAELKWDSSQKQPCNFTAYPWKEKLQAYRQGISQVEKKTRYGAILVSLHYASFLEAAEPNPVITAFIREEKQRREKLCGGLELEEDSEMVRQHFLLLQFSDDLSLFICMSKKEGDTREVIPWFRNGFRQSFSFAPNGFTASWQEREKVKVNPFPLEGPLTVLLPSYLLKKSEASEEKPKWQQTKKRLNRFTFTP